MGSSNQPLVIEFDTRRTLAGSLFEFYHPVHIANYVLQIWTKEPAEKENIYMDGCIIEPSMHEPFRNMEWARKENWADVELDRATFDRVIRDIVGDSSQRQSNSWDDDDCMSENQYQHQKKGIDGYNPLSLSPGLSKLLQRPKAKKKSSLLSF